MNLARILDDVARRHPELPAVTGRGITWTFAELARRAGAMGRNLRERHGLQPGDRVVLCMENTAECFELMFGCWYAGLAAVPANAKLHRKEVAYVCENSGARLLFVTPKLAESLAGLDRDVAGLEALISISDDRYRALQAGEPMAPADVAITDLAWLFYTSGTTGRPKGAMLTHRTLIFMSQCYYADIDHLTTTDTMLHAAPLSHGSGLYSLAGLFKGGHQVVLDGFDPAEIYAALKTYENVSFFAAPTMVTRLINAPEAARADTRNLKTITYGGAPMYVSDLKRALTVFGPKLFQLFGQGESPMTITGLTKAEHAASDHPRFEARLSSCGYPRNGVEVRIVDGEDRALPAGEIGEIVTRSDCVMAGYWQNAKATAETLRGGWLHTGDMGAIDADGLLTIKDRSKDMIISGGTNIYPREIEEVLLTHPDVLEVSVIGRPHADWGEEVVAFVVLRPGKTVMPAALDQLCLDNIARFKRPKDYRFTTALPKNNYGKILKTELRARLADSPRDERR